MSSEQATLGDAFRQPGPGDAVGDEPDWAPSDGDEGGTHCQSCGTRVTKQFARVYGDNQNRVHACQHCANNAILRDGGAADPDHDWRVDL